jgi:hypothetical protein
MTTMIDMDDELPTSKTGVQPKHYSEGLGNDKHPLAEFVTADHSVEYRR